MNERIVVEVLDRGGRVIERVRCEALPICIGRGYANQVILDDHFVSPAHARIDRNAEGALVLEDLQSLNGTVLLSPRRRVASSVIDADTRLQIGQTILRVRDAEHAVAPALAFSDVRSGLSSLRALAVLLASFAVLIGARYLDTFQEIKPLKIIVATMPFGVVLVAWAFAWSIVNRIVSHRFQTLAHVSIAALIGSAYLLYGEAVDYYAFAFAADRSIAVLEWLGTGVILAAAFYAHTSLFSAEPAPRLLLRSGLAAGSIVGLMAFTIYAAEYEGLTPNFPAQLKPPGFRVSGGSNVEQFVDETRALKSKLDELVAKARAEDPDVDEPPAAQ